MATIFGKIQINYPSASNTAAPILSPNTWCHVVAVRAAAACGGVTFFIDGIAVSSTEDSCFGTTPASGFGKTLIGTCCENGSFNQYVRGVIDDVRLHDRKLSAAEVALLYRLGMTRAK